MTYSGRQPCNSRQTGQLVNKRIRRHLVRIFEHTEPHSPDQITYSPLENKKSITTTTRISPEQRAPCDEYQEAPYPTWSSRQIGKPQGRVSPDTCDSDAAAATHGTVAQPHAVAFTSPNGRREQANTPLADQRKPDSRDCSSEMAIQQLAQLQHSRAQEQSN